MPVVTIGGRKVFVVPEGPTLKTPHIPIYIDDNSAFTKENGVVSGSGTSTDPYVIENCDINTSKNRGIEIRDTNAYFIIRNCIVHGDRSVDGIHINDVKNGKICGVNSYNNFRGIFLSSFSNTTITNCNVYNNFDYGIDMWDSSKTHITNCNLYINRLGVHLSKSSDIKIYGCNIYDNREYGVFNANSEKEYEVHAESNWWGDATIRPANKVSSNVVFVPWLKDKRGN